ncbi:hypothetical protein TMEN_6993 [Trichophyton mentagrophytes]|nr:hypothetical protein TMEN_6993 [Trichophyton mentagrophytes]
MARSRRGRFFGIFSSLRPSLLSVSQDLDQDTCPSLYGMPMEIVEIIANFLQYKSLCSLRLTCRLLYERTLRCFGAFLATVPLDFSSHSLQRLQAISNHRYLKRYVQCLSIMNQTHGKLGIDLRWDRSSSGCLIVPQDIVDILSDVLALLVNCRSFEVHHIYRREHQYTSNFLGGSDAIKILLYIIAETAFPVKSLMLERGVARGWRYGDHIHGERLDIPALHKLGVRAGLSQLQSLTLNYQKELESSIDWTCELIRAATSLTILTARLNEFDNAPLLFDRLTLANVLPPLKELVLESCEFSSLEGFIAFLHYFRSSLRTLSLTRIRLSTNGWISILPRLRELFPSLTSIKLHHLRGDKRPDTLISFPDIHKHKTSFEIRQGISYYYKNWRGKRSLVGVRYSGPDMETALRIVVSSARAC